MRNGIIVSFRATKKVSIIGENPRWKLIRSTIAKFSLWHQLIAFECYRRAIIWRDYTSSSSFCAIITYMYRDAIDRISFKRRVSRQYLVIFASYRQARCATFVYSVYILCIYTTYIYLYCVFIESYIRAAKDVHSKWNKLIYLRISKRYYIVL